MRKMKGKRDGRLLGWKMESESEEKRSKNDFRRCE